MDIFLLSAPCPEVARLSLSHGWTHSKRNPCTAGCYRRPPRNCEYRFKNYSPSTVSHGGTPHLLATRNADRDHQGWILASRGSSMSAWRMRSRSCITTRVFSKKTIRIPTANSSSWERTCAMSSFVHFRHQMAITNRSPSRRQTMLRMQLTARWITHGRLGASMGAYSKTTCGSKVGQRDIRVSTPSG